MHFRERFKLFVWVGSKRYWDRTQASNYHQSLHIYTYIYIKHLSKIIIKTPHYITQNLTLIFQWSFNIYHQMYDTLWRLTYGKLLHLYKSELILPASVLKSARFMYQQWKKIIKCIQTMQIHPPTPFLSLLMFFLSFLLLNANFSWFFVIILIINRWYYRKT